MLINKYIEEASKTELLSYKLVLSSQIIEAQKSLDLIENAQKKLDIKKQVARKTAGVVGVDFRKSLEIS